MRHVFENNSPQVINRFKPTNVYSRIPVSNVAGKIQRVTATVDIHHSFTRDLKIYLLAPGGKKVLLVGQEGGSGNNFLNTNFDDDSPTSIISASPPFSGTFRPEEPLKHLKGLDANGDWALQVQDVAYFDGGSLNRWALTLTVEEEEVTSNFKIDVRFLGGLTQTQRAVFETAAARWAEVIVGDLPTATVEGETIDDVLIEAKGASIDGPGGVLGQAGPTFVRNGSLLPVKGIMEFDVGDLARMESDGSLLDVIIHEMGHVLGLGTLWNLKGLLVNSGTANPLFAGFNSMREFSVLANRPAPTPVPVANTGGPGTREGHWRESVFGSELMTGFLDPGDNPLSRMSIASFEDLGYIVNYNSAAPYTIPSALNLAMAGISAEGGYGRRHCAACGPRALRTSPYVLPESAT